MIKPNDVFERIFCLTIPRRADRWLQTKERCDREDIDIESFYGIDSVDIKDEFKQFRESARYTIIDRPSTYAIAKGYIKLLRYAYFMEYPKVLLFQDDVTFHKDFAELFDKCYSQLPDNWDMFYLGGTIDNTEKERYSENLVYAKQVDGLFAVAIARNFIPKLLPAIESMYYPEDSAIKIVLQNKENNIFLAKPLICGHDYGWSDNYNFNFTKEIALAKSPSRYYDTEIYR